jgi:hypothetical protein
MNFSTLTTIFLTMAPTLLLSQTILTVLGPDQVVIREYSLNDLDALEQTVFETENPYIDGLSTFSGPSLELIVDKTGYPDPASGFITLTAINDYQVKLPVTDFRSYDVMLATRRDGEEMSLRDKGPIWVIYPMSDNLELQDPVYNGRLVWQLKSLQVVE